jgi:hypothetical protein
MRHEAADATDFVLPHDQPEDPNHVANWRRCRLCSCLYWDGLWMKGLCVATTDPKNPVVHDPRGNEDFLKFLQDELILTHDVPGDSNHQGNWHLCIKCLGLFNGSDPLNNKCPFDNTPHTSDESDDHGKLRLPHLAGRVEPPVGYNFVLPHDLPEDASHQAGWHRCTKCGLLYSDLNKCPAGGSHLPSGEQFALPRRIQEDQHNDRDWRFCTKCFGLVSTKAGQQFWTLDSAVVRNANFSGLPSQTGDGLVILVYDLTVFHLAWMPLGPSGPRLQDVQYYSGQPGAAWSKNEEEAAELFGSNLSDANRISLAWLEGPQRWIVLHGGSDAVVARLGTTLWNWSDETQIISLNSVETSILYTEKFSNQNPRTHPYGPSILKRFTEWDPATRVLGIYYLISLSKGYQVHLMRTQLKLDPA